MSAKKFDVLCIGSGVAGMMASIEAANRGANVCLVSKEPLGWGNTRISGGLIGSKGSNKQSFLSDMLTSGNGLNQPELLEILFSNSNGIHELIESWGHLFAHEGHPSERKKIKPGGHSEARSFISHYRGIHLANILRSRLVASKIEVIEEVIACKVLVDNDKVNGVLLFDWKTGEWSTVFSTSVIIACGGGGMLYFPHTDNMRSATGDGYALGLQAGAELIDMEQIQFMPFGVAYPEGMLGLEIGDTSAAGPYGVLKNSDGKVICRALTNKTREEVSRLIALEVQKGKASPHGGVWLDPTENRRHSGGEEAWENWKAIGSLDPLKLAASSRAYQWKEPFEVLPTQHYIMGGLAINGKGQTKVPGLYAAGESAGGIHGAGRMGSMSLFEGLVFGKIIGEETSSISRQKVDEDTESIKEEIESFKTYVSRQQGNYHPIQLKLELGEIMWKYAGVIRTEQGLVKGLALLDNIEEKSQRLNLNWSKGYNQPLLEAIELRFMITTARCILQSALLRKESRGSHFREDYPAKIDGPMRRNVITLDKHQKLLHSLRWVSNG